MAHVMQRMKEGSVNHRVEESGKSLLEGFWRVGKGAAQGTTEWGSSMRAQGRLVHKNSQLFQAALLCDSHHEDSRRTWMLCFTHGLGFTQMKGKGGRSIARTTAESWAGKSKLR